jgi:primary-amine oxidase
VTNSHPLDPLSADEIRQAAATVRRDRRVGDTWRFASIELKEPAKAALPDLAVSAQPSREAIVVGWDRADGQACRATVSLTGDKVTSWEDLPGQQPNMTVAVQSTPLRTEQEGKLAARAGAERQDYDWARSAAGRS